MTMAETRPSYRNRRMAKVQNKAMAADVSRRLWQLREARGLARRTVREQKGIADSQLQRIETGEASPRYVDIVALCELYGVPVVAVTDGAYDFEKLLAAVQLERLVKNAIAYEDEEPEEPVYGQEE